MKVLVSWIGAADLKAASGQGDGQGPVANAVEALDFDRLELLCNFSKKDSGHFEGWLSKRTKAEINVQWVKLSSPTDFKEIYEVVLAAIEAVLKDRSPQPELTFHLSPGTPAMATIWILLAKTRFPAQLIQSSKEQGVQKAVVPFEIAAEFVPQMMSRLGKDVERLATGLPEGVTTFDDMVYRSANMKRIVERAYFVAAYDVTVLIEGETGTGKEVLACAIHESSERASGPFIVVNCGAIPKGLAESELFGHVKGAFTDAKKERLGHFREASGGTLFLDEIGELELDLQAKLLRTLQERKIVPVGASEEIPIDVRIIAATNRNLVEEVAAKKFRQDLLFRLAVAVLKLPLLTDRPGDITLLIDHFMEEVNRKFVEHPRWKPKKLSAKARSLLLKHSWPGNIRELQNTLVRAAIWQTASTISEKDVREALMPVSKPDQGKWEDRRLGDGFSLDDLLAEVGREYVQRALKETGGVKSRAAKKLGLNNATTLRNRIEKYGVE